MRKTGFLIWFYPLVVFIEICVLGVLLQRRFVRGMDPIAQHGK